MKKTFDRGMTESRRAPPAACPENITGLCRQPVKMPLHPAGENVTWTMEIEWPNFKMKARCEEQFIPVKSGTGFAEVCHNISVS